MTDASPDPTLSEARQHRKDLETTISNAMSRFGELTGLTVQCVNVEITDSRLAYDKGLTEDPTGVKITYEVDATVEL